MRRLLIVILLLASVTSVKAEFYTGNEISSQLDECGGGAVYECTFAQGFIIGVADTVALYQSFNKDTVCFPPTSTAGQTIAVVEKYFKDNPAKLHLTASSSVVVALENAFPCE